MPLHVVRVDPLQEHRVRVEFSDGTLEGVDLSAELYGEVFEPLRRAELFSQVAVNRDAGKETAGLPVNPGAPLIRSAACVESYGFAASTRYTRPPDTTATRSPRAK